MILRRALQGAVLLVAMLSLPALADASPGAVPPGFQNEVLFSGLKSPSNFEIAPDGRTFVALKNGEIKVFPANSVPNATPETFADLRKQVNDYGDRGVLGLALDPKFDQGRPYVYLLYTYDHELGVAGETPRWGQLSKSYEGDECPEPANGCQVSGRIVRLTAEGNHAGPEQKVLVEGWCQQFNSHSIGDLKFGPEGALFATGGEGASYNQPDYGQFGNPCNDPPTAVGTNPVPPTAEGGSLRAQSPLRPSGKVLLNGTLLRIDPETGAGWPGNPMAASSNANAKRILGFGFRNPFRFAINPRAKEVFVDNVGANSVEEIDRVPIEETTAYNSGWPCYEGLEPNPQFQTIGLNACTRLYETPGSTATPFFRYTHTSPVAPGDTCTTTAGSAISGADFYEGSTYPSKYDNALFFSDSVRGCIYVMYADEDGEPDPAMVVPFLSEPNVYPGTDIESGPNGEILYASIGAGTIDRITYDPAAPQAKLTASKEYGPVTPTPLTIEFKAGESTSQGGHALKYEWDLDGNGQFNDGTGPTQTHSYSAATNVTVAVRVEDEVTHKTSVARTTIYPGDTPPAVTIPKPLASLKWEVGQKIPFSGSARENGGSGPAVPASSLYWKVRLLHCPFGPTECHEHPLQVFPGTESGEILAPDHDFPSYLNFVLTATDGRGLSNERMVKIEAISEPLQLRSEPSGIALVAGIKSEATPFELSVIKNSPTTIAAPETVELGGVEYVFREWSDGGARIHTVGGIVPATYTAFYDPVSGPLPTGPTGTSGTSSTGVPASTEAGTMPTAPAPPAAIPRLEQLKLLRHPRKTARRGVARFAFTGPAGVTFRCRLDNEQFAACHSPSVYRELGVGPHVFRVKGVATDGVALAPIRRFTWSIAGTSSQRAR